MPDFVFTSPDGQKFRITGPEGSTQEQAFEILQKQMGGAQPAAPAAPEDADPFKATARKELAEMKSAGVHVGDGRSRQFLQGMTFGAADEVLAGLTTPLEMIKRRTINPVEGYNYAKAREDVLLEDARKDGGIGGTLAEVAGGVATGGMLAKGGATLMDASKGVMANIPRMAAEGAIYGGVTGFNEGSGTGRLTGAATGAAVGGVAGGVVGAAAPLVSGATRNVAGFISASRDPEKYAGGQLARALSESGKTPSQIAQEVADARAMGQPFTIADALGNPGQRMLSTVARNPGAGRTEVVETLTARQADQAPRVGAFIDDALGANTTGRQTQRELMKRASEDAGPLYEKALSREFVWNPRIQRFLDDPIAQQGISKGMAIQRLESVAQNKPFNPKDYGVVDFDAAGNNIKMGVPNMRTLNVLKKGIDDILEGYRDKTTGKLVLDEYGRAVDMYRRSLVTELKKANPDYAKALEAWSGPASVSEAVGIGRQAATRGRAADNLDTFGALGGPQQGGYRIGYADSLNNTIERTGREGVNVAGKFTSPKYKTELDALSLYQGPREPGKGDMLAKALQNERTMSETLGRATKNSVTAEQLADNAAMSSGPEVVGNLLSGNFKTAALNAIVRSRDTLSGNTPAVREALAKALLRGDGSKAALEQALTGVVQDKQLRDQLVKALLSGSFGGVAAGSSPVRQRN